MSGSIPPSSTHPHTFHPQDFAPTIICRAGPRDPTISTKSAVIMRCLGLPKRPAPDAAGEGGDHRQLQEERRREKEERGARLLLERLEQQGRQEAAAAAVAVAMLRHHQQRQPALGDMLPHAPIFHKQGT